MFAAHKASTRHPHGLEAARDAVEDPAVATDAAKLTAALAEMELAQEESDRLYARWAELTEKAG